MTTPRSRRCPSCRYASSAFNCVWRPTGLSVCARVRVCMCVCPRRMCDCVLRVAPTCTCKHRRPAGIVRLSSPPSSFVPADSLTHSHTSHPHTHARHTHRTSLCCPSCLESSRRGSPRGQAATLGSSACQTARVCVVVLEPLLPKTAFPVVISKSRQEMDASECDVGQAVCMRARIFMKRRE